jgi:sRNA-binding carbon storage regulator CsrA
MESDIKRLVVTRSRKRNVLWIGEARVILEASSNVKVTVEAPESVKVVRGEVRAA